MNHSKHTQKFPLQANRIVNMMRQYSGTKKNSTFIFKIRLEKHFVLLVSLNFILINILNVVNINVTECKPPLIRKVSYLVTVVSDNQLQLLCASTSLDRNWSEKQNKKKSYNNLNKMSTS